MSDTPIKKLMEEVIEHCRDANLFEESKKAKDEYFSPYGIPDSEDLSFASQMDTYLNWYLIDRRLHSLGITPLEHFSEHAGSIHENSKWQMVHNLYNSILSLFIVTHVSKDQFRVVDIFKNKKYTIMESECLFSFEKDTIFEGRIVKEENQYVILKGVLFYPSVVLDYIKKKMKTGMTDHSLFMRELAAKKIRAERYKIPDIMAIYEKDIFISDKSRR